MKRGLKILFIIVGIVVILGIIFFAVDYNRVQKQEKPISVYKIQQELLGMEEQ